MRMLWALGRPCATEPIFIRGFSKKERHTTTMHQGATRESPVSHQRAAEEPPRSTLWEPMLPGMLKNEL